MILIDDLNEEQSGECRLASRKYEGDFLELTATIPLSKIEKIELYQNLNRLPMASIKAKTGADYIINGGIYSFKTFKPFGNVKIDGKVIYNPGYGEYGFAWNSGADIAYEKLPSNRNSYIGCCGLLLGGIKQVLHYNPDMGSKRQRSASGLKKGNLVLYACNGIHSKTPESLQTYVMKQGWQSGLMLDGGNSVQCIFPTGTIKSPENNGKGRIVQNYILVYLKKASTSDSKSTQSVKCPYKEPIITVKSGTRGESARWVQWHLVQAGYDIGKIDGVFGSKSASALISFQTKTGLEADGLCGRITREKLKSELKE